MTKIGIIGAGNIGKAFAGHVTKAGYETIISNSRGPESLRSTVAEIGNGLKAGTTAEAAAADIVFLAVPWDKLPDAISVVPTWDNRIVIDATNAILPGFVAAELGGKTSSEVVSSMVGSAKLVKAFNTLFASVLGASPTDAGGKRVIFYAGDNNEAKEVISELIDKIGFAGVDLGKLNEGGKLQHFPGGTLTTLNLIKVN
jgi:predicted dinucleotide-binding enzyme